MNISNIKTYLAISFAMIFLLILIVVIPFSKKPTVNQQTQSNNNFPTPTSVAVSGQVNSQIQNKVSPTPINIPANFTGAVIETIPPQIVSLSTQKQDLRPKTPLNMGTFTINFDYGQDKFTVSLTDPKDQAQKNFDNWRTTNYPSLGLEQFIFN